MKCARCPTTTQDPEEAGWLKVEFVGMDTDTWICPRDAFVQYWDRCQWLDKLLVEERQRADRIHDALRPMVNTLAVVLILTNAIWVVALMLVVWKLSP